jgi:hypothetical protein
VRIGIDIGGVIIGGGGEDTSFFSDNYLKTPEIEGAWDSLDLLDMDDHELHIISKCGPVVEAKSVAWLDQKMFFLSIPRHHTHFVRKRELKAPMAQALELDVFIDDRQDIIDSMQGIVKHPILFESWKTTMQELGLIFAQDG